MGVVHKATGAILFLLLSVTSAAAQDAPPDTEQKIVADDPSDNAQFGSAVAVDSLFAIVGSRDDNANGDDAGSAYFFALQNSNWVQTQKILANDAESGDGFGSAVSLYGSVAAIGSPGDEGERGGVYLFRETGGAWAQAQKVSADDGAAGDRFGESLSLFGDILVVGSARHDGGEGGAAVDAGAVYVYRFNGSTWNLETKLSAADATIGDLFGASVGIYGNVIGVGASREDSTARDAGSVYTYRHDGVSWLFEQKLVADDGNEFDLLGSAVAVGDSTVIAGAYGDDSGDRNSGSAYIWSYDGVEWLQDVRLSASDPEKDDHFGHAVSLSDSLAVIGAHWNSRGGNFAVGSAYVFQRESSGWTQIQKLTASDGSELDLFGDAVAVTGFRVFIGAPRNDDTATDTGSAYFYSFPRPDPSVDPPPDVVAIENSTRDIPSAFQIISVYPNPFRDRVHVEFELVRAAPVQLTVFNLAGQEVARIDRGYGVRGRNTILWEPGLLASGVYLIRMQTDFHTATSKVVLLR